MRANLLIRFVLSLLLIAASLPGWAQMRFQEGTDYQILPGTPSNKKHVIEFFSYSCPHCYTLDPVIESYLASAPAEYTFERIPVSFGRTDWQNSAEVYTLTGLLGNREALHQKVFEKIHELHRPFRNDGEVKSFFLANGVDEEKYDSVADSFSAKSALKRNEELTRKFRVSSVPTVIVRDIYEVELSRVRSAEQLEELVEFLMRL